MNDENWLIYGANGYSGRLLAERAVAAGMRPILAGRNEKAIAPLAAELGLSYKIFPLDNVDHIAREIAGMRAVFLAAGPFGETSGPVVDACLRVGAHYMDITGEIRVLSACHRKDAEARARGITIISGIGFDVTPTDCMAAALHAQLPDAQKLELAFALGPHVSPGTAKTLLEGIFVIGVVRENKKMRRVSVAWKKKMIAFRDHSRIAITVPWGDLSTAFYSTRIPNIRVYMAMHEKWIYTLRIVRYISPLLLIGPLRRALQQIVGPRVHGPNATERAQTRSQVWGRVVDARGVTVEGTLETPEAYELTTRTSLECVRRLLGGGVPVGALTPSQAFGWRFITEIEGCDLRLSTDSPSSDAAKSFTRAPRDVQRALD